MKKFLLLIWLCLSGCSVLELKKPDIELQSVQIKRVALVEMGLVANLKVGNPNNKDVTISSIQYVVDFNEKNLSADTIKGPWTFPKNSSTEIQLPVHLNTQNLLESFSVLKDGENTVKFRGEAIINNMRVPFKGEKKVQLNL